MKEVIKMSKQALTKKVIHILIIAIIIIAILFTAILFILKYDEKGETNMPFSVSKITVISTADGQDVENPQAKWDKTINQNNDIFVYVEKNNQYSKTETISSVKLENFQIEKNSDIGEIKFYKQSNDEKALYKNIEENSFDVLEFKGVKASNAKNMEISNQGGIVEFRCANNNIGTYKSDEDTEINYGELLKKINVNEEDLNVDIYFDLTIKLDSGKGFKAEKIKLSIPNPNLINEGRVGQEFDYSDKIVFKRIEN